MLSRHLPRRCGGFSLLEVLVTILLLAFGLLGLASLQVRMVAANSEAYQRAQAAALLADMIERVRAGSNDSLGTINSGYLTGTGSVGTGDSNTVTNCSTVAIGSARDMCEWSNALKGTGETSGTASVGAMIGGRGCITQVQAANPTKNICTPGIYGVAVAWQGLSATAAPPTTGWAACGANQYGNDAQRRVLSARVVIPLPSC
jgi:type IV pilus assembly protein PilV